MQSSEQALTSRGSTSVATRNEIQTRCWRLSSKGRSQTLHFLTDAATRAGVDVSPGAAWLLLRTNAPDSLEELRRLPQVDPARFDATLEEVRGQGYMSDGDLTDAGRAARDSLVAARTDLLREVVEDWEPDRHPELDPLLRRLAAEFAPAPRAV